MTGHTPIDAVPYALLTDAIIDWPATSQALAELLERWRPTRTALPPATPADGDGWLYPADDANGVVWDLRYRNGMAQPWRFVGGSPLMAQVLTDEAVPPPQTTYAPLATPVAIAIPFAGVYDVSFGALMYAAASVGVYYAPSLGAAPANDNDAIQEVIPAAGLSLTATRTIRRTYAAGTLTLYHRASGLTATNALRRWMSVRPVALAP